MPAHHPIYNNPLWWKGPQVLLSKDTAEVGNDQTQSEESNKSKRSADARRAEAGGFTKKMWQMRDKQETFSGMMFFHD